MDTGSEREEAMSGRKVEHAEWRVQWGGNLQRGPGIWTELGPLTSLDLTLMSPPQK